MFLFLFYKNLHFQIKEDDYLPLTICTECFSKLNLFNVFKTSCLEAQEVLGFIFIDKKPIQETITKNENLTLDDKIDEIIVEEIEDPVQPELISGNVEVIDSAVEEDELMKLMEVIHDDNAENEVNDDDEDEKHTILLDDPEMIEEEYLNDSNTENEKGIRYNLDE